MKNKQTEYRKLYKWGDPDKETEIDEKLAELILEKSPTVFDKKPEFPSIDQLELTKISLDTKIIEQLRIIVGNENVSTDDFDRIRHTYGRSYGDLLKMRLHLISFPPDVIVYPRDEKDVVKIIEICNTNKIPIIPTGGITSVTEGFEFKKGGVALNLTKHMNTKITLHHANSSVTVDAGVLGPKLEQCLNKEGYTCGHFPQSFEYSSVGGWVAARGAGQESTGYGKIEDMVLGLRIICPVGVIDVEDYPARSTGPDIKEIIMGSEGIFGVITRVTLKVWQHDSSNMIPFAYLFKDWKDGLHAVRTTMQARIGMPSVFRLSDPEESDNYIRLAEIASWKDKALNIFGYHNKKRVLLMGTVNGEKEYVKFVMKKLKKHFKKMGGFSAGSSAVRSWLKERFDTPYLREPLMDNGILIDTLETTCTWENIEEVWKETTNTINKRKDTISMCHASHIYENGANLYFVIMSKAVEDNQVEDYQSYQKSIIETIISSGGSLSHHHGIGRLYAPWLEERLGKTAFKLLKAIKKELDPNGIMNPGALNL